MASSYKLFVMFFLIFVSVAGNGQGLTHRRLLLPFPGSDSPGGPKFPLPKLGGASTSSSSAIANSLAGNPIVPYFPSPVIQPGNPVVPYFPSPVIQPGNPVGPYFPSPMIQPGNPIVPYFPSPVIQPGNPIVPYFPGPTIPPPTTATSTTSP